jgi:D-alanyl-D-alanine carboxypeptidase (penicillin-binding protein 5/6)
MSRIFKKIPSPVTKYFLHTLCYLCAVTLFMHPADAKKIKKAVSAPRCMAQTIEGDFLPCRKSPPSSLVVDAKTGKVLHEEGASDIIHPASLTKLMTLYLAFEEIEKGNLQLDRTIPVSARAASLPPLTLGLRSGDRITVRDAVMGSIVRSANDAAVAIGEAIGGSEAKFATLMTKRARQLGMQDTKFVNASGWHHKDQCTTAKDLAKLAIAIKRDFPEYYKWFAQTEFQFRGKTVRGHNRVTLNYPGAEGLKTGFHNPAGACIVTTASRNNKSLVGIVTGSPSGRHRDNKVMSLLDKHFGVHAQRVSAEVPRHSKLTKKKYTKTQSNRKHRAV